MSEEKLKRDARRKKKESGPKWLSAKRNWLTRVNLESSLKSDCELQKFSCPELGYVETKEVGLMSIAPLQV